MLYTAGKNDTRANHDNFFSTSKFSLSRNALKTQKCKQVFVWIVDRLIKEKKNVIEHKRKSDHLVMKGTLIPEPPSSFATDISPAQFCSSKSSLILSGLSVRKQKILNAFRIGLSYCFQRINFEKLSDTEGLKQIFYAGRHIMCYTSRQNYNHFI